MQADAQDKKRQHAEDTGHVADVVIRRQGKSQRQRIQPASAVPDEPYQPQHHQGQQRYCIQPHDIPVIAGDVVTQGIEHGKANQGHIPAPEQILQKHAAEQAGKAHLQHHKQGQRLPEPCRRKEHSEKIQRACGVIGGKTEEIGPQPGAPGVQHGAAGLELFL